jgi:serine/threonine protein kinase
MRSGSVLGGRFRLDHELGGGGMGQVWAATDLRSAEEVAVKLVRPSDTEAPGRSFLREARAMRAIAHPHVVRIHEVVEDGEHPAIVMERLHGETLGERLAREGRIDVRDALDLLTGVAEAVAAAHEAGVVHRDLKPGNIFVEDGAHAKILDFGVAKVRPAPDETRGSTTGAGAFVGTPAYMAPEQVFGEPDLDGAADVWALGVILYECLSGISPTLGENVGQTLKFILARPLWPLRDVAPDVPEPLALLVDEMLDRDRHARPEMSVVVDALCAIRDGRPMPPRKQRDALGTPHARRPQRWKFMALAAVVVLIATAALGSERYPTHAQYALQGPWSVPIPTAPSAQGADARAEDRKAPPRASKPTKSTAPQPEQDLLADRDPPDPQDLLADRDPPRPPPAKDPERVLAPRQ